MESDRNAAAAALLAVLAGLSACRNTNSTLASNGLPSIASTSPGVTVTGGPSDYTVDFGQVAIGQQLQALLSLTDLGNSPLQILAVDSPTDPQFAVGLTAGTGIESGNSIQVPCTFKPFGSGPKTSTVLIHTDSQSIPTVTLNLKGVGVALKLRVDPETLEFGTVVVHSTLTRSIVLTNQSALDLTVTESAVQGSSAPLFVYDPTSAAASTFTLQASGSQSISFTYQPQIPSLADTAYITLTPSIGPQIIVSLRGVAAETGLTITPSPMDFNFVQPGQVSTQTLRIKNIGNQDINVTQVSITNPGGGAFAIPSGTVTSATPLSVNTELDIPVTFSPVSNALYGGEISIVSNDNLGQSSVPLKGFGGGAAIRCSPPALDFGVVAAGIGSTQPVLCTNTGTNVPNHPEAGLLIGQLPTTSAAFDANLAQGTPQGYLLAGETAVLDVSYTPGGATIDSATLTVKSNVINPPVINLTGQGIVVGRCNYSIAPSSLSWGAVPGADKSLRYTEAFTIRNQGPDVCVVAGLHLGQSNGGAFALPDGPVVSQLLAAPGQPQAVDGGDLPVAISVPVSFAAAQGTGSYAGQVAFTISDPTAPSQQVNLTALAGESCFFLQPNPLDLGTAGLTSNGQFCQKNHKQFVGTNNCAQTVTVNSVNLGTGAPFDEADGPSLPLVLASGTSSTPFVIGFSPTVAGDFYGAVAVQTDLQAVPFGLTVHGKALAGTVQSDTFQGISVASVDILWVIDTDDLNAELTCCGAPPGLLDKLADFVAAVPAGVDYQMAVLGDDCPMKDLGNLEPCDTCYNTGPGPTFITPATPDPGAALEGMIKTISLGAGGFGCTAYEAPMIAAWEAMQPHLLSGHNAGFLRDGATLSVMAYDPDGNLEDEGSPESVQFYLNFFSSLKGGDAQLVNVSLMYADVYGGATKIPPGPRYNGLARASGGLTLDTYGQDWTKQISQLWGNLSAGGGGFPLSGTPIPDTIQVWLDGPPPGPGVTTHGLQIEQQNVGGVWNWQYVPGSNSVVLNSQNISVGPTDTLTVVYTLACN